MHRSREFKEIANAARVAVYCGECGNRKGERHFCDTCLLLLPEGIKHGLPIWRSSAAAYHAAIRHFERNPTPRRPLIGKPRRLLGGTRNANRYHNDFEVSARLDCNYRVACDTLPAALSACEPRRHCDPFFSVHVDCSFDGVAATAHVGLNLSEAEGKPEAEIWSLLDFEVDTYIAARVNTGHWHPWRPVEDLSAKRR